MSLFRVLVIGVRTSGVGVTAITIIIITTSSSSLQHHHHPQYCTGAETYFGVIIRCSYLE